MRSSSDDLPHKINTTFIPPWREGHSIFALIKLQPFFGENLGFYNTQHHTETRLRI